MESVPPVPMIPWHQFENFVIQYNTLVKPLYQSIEDAHISQDDAQTLLPWKISKLYKSLSKIIRENCIRQP
jgi:hypothetical protein